MQDGRIDAIAFREVPDACQGPIRNWFEGRIPALQVDGARSVHIAHPDGGGRVIKIKGAGLNGGPIQFGVHHNTGPKAAQFDYDGRMMDDVASGWDGAFEGGASFQQAVTEHRVSQYLSAVGYDVIPSLGYGRVTQDGVSSWFVVLDHEADLRPEPDMLYPDIGMEEWKHLNVVIGELMIELAVQHDLIGHCWYRGTTDGRLLIRDLHPFRRADPFNMSQVSWTMQLLYALHIRSNATRFRALRRQDPAEPVDLHVWQYRAVCPEASLADHDRIRKEIVIPYMLAPPQDFSFDRLVTVLRGNPISAALMDVCPSKFARA